MEFCTTVHSNGGFGIVYYRRSAILIAMDQWPIQIRIQAVEAFIRLNSVIAVQRFLRQGDRHLRVPDRRTIVRWVQSWREHGKVENKKSSAGQEPSEHLRISIVFEQKFSKVHSTQPVDIR
ncbi:hypothetical protein C0J52_06663 [Blattella germanica]|nr:hypothetical protein C0J52_06663 [Blattella germanica]